VRVALLRWWLAAKKEHDTSLFQRHGLVQVTLPNHLACAYGFEKKRFHPLNNATLPSPPLRLAATPQEIGMATGATIHTANGMMVSVSRRQAPGSSASAGGQQQQPVAV
jgi:hypothetical protein